MAAPIFWVPTVAVCAALQQAHLFSKLAFSRTICRSADARCLAPLAAPIDITDGTFLRRSRGPSVLVACFSAASFPGT